VHADADKTLEHMMQLEKSHVRAAIGMINALALKIKKRRTIKAVE